MVYAENRNKVTEAMEINDDAEAILDRPGEEKMVLRGPDVSGWGS